MKKRHLVLVVSSYPYEKGETFLENEFKQISQGFEQVHLIQTQLIAPQEETVFFTPSHAKLHNIAINISRVEQLIGLRFLVSKSFWRELRAIKKELGLSLSVFKIKVIFSYLIRAHKFKAALKQYLDGQQVNLEDTVIYTYWQTEATLASVYLKQEVQDLKVISRVHGWDIYAELSKEGYLPFRTFMNPLLDCLVTISAHGTRYLLNKYPNSQAKELQTLYLGTEPLVNLLGPAPTRTKDTIYISSISRTIHVKRMERLIIALTRVSPNIQIKWRHLGGDFDEKEIRVFASKTLDGISNIDYSISGHVEHSVVKEKLKTEPYIVLINTSESEGLPVSMMEAASCGLPIIGTDVGGVNEIIEHNGNGYLIPHDNRTEEEIITDLTDAIEKMVGLSSEEYQRMRERSYAIWQERFVTQRNAEKMLALLQS